MAAVLALALGRQRWFWEIADEVALTLIALNVLLLAAVHLRRLRQYLRRGRTKRFRAEVEVILAELDPATRQRDPGWLRERLSRFEERDRPIAATLLIERLEPATPEEREFALAALREAGAVARIVRYAGRRLPWQRALALRTLGWIGAEEGVPVAVARLGDRNRHVRDSAVRALGRIGDPVALPHLEQLFLSPGRLGAGVVYEALLDFGSRAEPIFTGALRSPAASVRVAACFGVSAVAEPAAARHSLEPLLGDAAGPVRSAAAEALGHVGGEDLPPALADASWDAQAAVRSAAAGALGSFDDPLAVEAALAALLDPDRDTAICAGEALVRLSRGPRAGPAAARAVRESEAWPVERALAFASVEAV